MMPQPQRVDWRWAICTALAVWSRSVSPEIFVVPSAQLDAAWPEIKAQIERVADRPWEPEDVYDDLRALRAQAWGLRTDKVLGFWITQIVTKYATRYGVVWIAAGEGLEEGLALYREHIEPWFKAKGCKFIQLQGRRGWKRVMPDYEETAVILTKRL